MMAGISCDGTLHRISPNPPYPRVFSKTPLQDTAHHLPPHQPQCPLPANFFLAYHHPRHHEGTRTRAERLFVLRTPNTLSTALATPPIKRGCITAQATPEPAAPIAHTHNGSKTAVLLADPCQHSLLLAQSVACASNLQGLPARAEGFHPAIFHGSTSHRCSSCLLWPSVVKITMSSVAPPNQNCEALQPIRYDPIAIQLCTLGDNCNDMLCVIPTHLSSGLIEPLLRREGSLHSGCRSDQLQFRLVRAKISGCALNLIPALA